MSIIRRKVKQPLYARTVPFITSTDGSKFFLLPNLIVEDCGGAYWFAFRSAFAGLILGETGEIEYATVGSGGSAGAHDATFVLYDRNNLDTGWHSAKRGDVGVGCQLFTGENAKLFRKWIRGAK